METRRSVTPNKGLIEHLRKEKMLTIERLSLDADIGMRTAQKAVAGHPISMDSLERIARALGVEYATLLGEKPQDASAPGSNRWEIKLVLSGGDDPASQAKLLEVMAFLKKFLPENAGLCLIGAFAGSAVIGIGRSQANEAALADPVLKMGLNALGVKGYGEVRAIAETIRVLGEAEPHNYLEAASVNYTWYRSATAQNDMSIPPIDTWEELTDRERLEFCIKSKEAFLAEVEKAKSYDWALIKGDKRLDSKASPAELFAFAKAEMAAIEDSDPERHEELWRLSHICKNRDMLSQMRDILDGLDE